MQHRQPAEIAFAVTEEFSMWLKFVFLYKVFGDGGLRCCSRWAQGIE